MQDYLFKLFGVKGDARYSSKSFRKYGADFPSRQGNIDGVCILGAFFGLSGWERILDCFKIS